MLALLQNVETVGVPHRERAARRKAFVGKLLTELYRHEREGGHDELGAWVALIGIYQAEMFNASTKIQDLTQHFGRSRVATAAFVSNLSRHGVLQCHRGHYDRDVVGLTLTARKRMNEFFDALMGASQSH